MSDKKKLYVGLLENLVLNYSLFELQIKKALKKNEQEKTIRIIHTLKRTAEEKDALLFQNKMNKLEYSINNGKIPEWEPILDELIASLTETIETIKEYSAYSDNCETINLDKTELAFLIDQTELQVKRYNPNAIRNIERIAFPKECEYDINKLKSSLQKYDFVQASINIEKIKDILSRL